MFPKAGIWHHAPHGAVARPTSCRHRRSLPGILASGGTSHLLITACEAGAMQPGPSRGAARRSKLSEPGSAARHAWPAWLSLPCHGDTAVHGRRHDGALLSRSAAGPRPPAQPSPWPPPTPTADFPAEHQGLLFRAQLSVLWKHGNYIPVHGADSITSVTH